MARKEIRCEIFTMANILNEKSKKYVHDCAREINAATNTLEDFLAIE